MLNSSNTSGYYSVEIFHRMRPYEILSLLPISLIAEFDPKPRMKDLILTTWKTYYSFIIIVARQVIKAIQCPIRNS